MAQHEEIVLWLDRRWKNAIEKHLKGETLQEHLETVLDALCNHFRSVSMSASAVRSSRKLPHSVRRKKRTELMPPTM